MSPDQTFNIAICGLGRIGKVHWDNFRNIPNVKVIYGIEAILDVGRAACKQRKLPVNGFLYPLSDLDKLLADRQLHAVIICTPTSTHLELAQKCVKAGKAVLLEKPVATNMKDVLTMYDYVEKNKGILLTAFQRNFDHQTEVLMNKASTMGPISYMRLCARDSVGSAPPSIDYLKASGGFFVDSAIHDIDQMLQFVKSTPETIFAGGHAHKAIYKKANDYDQIIITVKFINGTLATLDLSRNSPYGYDQRIEIFTLKGMLQSENQREHAILDTTGTHTIVPAIIAGLEGGIHGRYGAAYRKEAEYFVKFAQGNATECPITNQSSLMAHMVAFAAIDSAKENKSINFKEYEKELRETL